MKLNPGFLFLLLGIAIVLATFFSIRQFNPEEVEFSREDLLTFRQLKNKSLSSRVGAPFYQDPNFDSLSYFPPNAGERYVSEVSWLDNPTEIDLMPDRPGYASHIRVGFVVLAKETWRDSLYFFKNLEEKDDSLYFVPFSDPGNGKESYGGGRYLDLVLKKGKKALVDFNYAYNPWCAYKPEFVCARIPSENRLSREILAGEKQFPDEKHE